MKYTYMTRFSILAVGILFLLQVFQAFIVYRVTHTNVTLLQLSLNSVADSVYTQNMNIGFDINQLTDTAHFIYSGSIRNTVDTTKVIRFNSNTTVSLAKEEFINPRHPINLQQADSLAQIIFARNNINLKFYSQIVDANSNKVLETTLPVSEKPVHVLYSQKVPLDTEQAKAFRLVLISPDWQISPPVLWILGIALLLSVLCIYNLFLQKKHLARQKELAVLKNEFFSQISHEFKRPLAVLRQLLSSLHNDNVLVNKKRIEMIMLGNEEIDRMASHTEMLLSLAQDDEGLFELYYTEFDLVKVVFDLADRFIETTPGSPQIDVDNELKDPMIFADKDHIEHLLSNLISNAIKYSKELSVDIHIRLYKQNDAICISVKDAGIGISSEDLSLIFERYARVGERTYAKGHGIGLNYAMRIAQKHNGSISVKSQLNVGSEFIVKLPATNNPNK